MNNLCCREEGEKFQLFIDQAWQQHTILYQTLKKWFMDGLILAFSFSNNNNEDATDQFYCHLGEGEGNMH